MNNLSYICIEVQADTYEMELDILNKINLADSK